MSGLEPGRHGQPVYATLVTFAAAFLILIVLDSALSWLTAKRLNLDDVAPLFAAIYAGRKFAIQHGRTAEGSELWKLTIVSLVIVYALSALAFAFAAYASGFPLATWWNELRLGSPALFTLLWFAAIGLGLNGLLIWLSFGRLTRAVLWLEDRMRKSGS